MSMRQGSFLDLCTGPGTQAAAQAEREFIVTAMDISPSAIEEAEKLSDRVDFRVGDILQPNLNRQFDFIFDRGCFHVLPASRRRRYVLSVIGLLKCFSKQEPGFLGLHRFSPQDIQSIFSKHFRIESVRESNFVGTRGMAAAALFAVLRKQEVR